MQDSAFGARQIEMRNRVLGVDLASIETHQTFVGVVQRHHQAAPEMLFSRWGQDPQVRKSLTHRALGR